MLPRVALAMTQLIFATAIVSSTRHYTVVASNRISLTRTFSKSNFLALTRVFYPIVKERLHNPGCWVIL